MPALTPLASYGSGVLPQGLLPSVYLASKAGQNNGTFGGKKTATAQNGQINLQCGQDDTEIGVRQRRGSRHSRPSTS